MRVAIVSPYALSAFGGAQEQALAMSRELIRRGHDVLIVAPDGHDHATYDTPAHVARFGARPQGPGQRQSRAAHALAVGGATRARAPIAHFRPDVVHFHEPFAPLIGWGALRAHGAPAVATFHRGGGGPALT